MRLRRVTALVVAVATCLAGCAKERTDGLRSAASVTSTTMADAGSTPRAGGQVCGVAPEAGLSTSTVEVGGRSYPVEIYQPSGRQPAPIAAVLDLHGLDSNGPAQAALTKFRTLADREGFVVAEPSGPIGPLGVTGWEIKAVAEPDRDDVAAIDQLIENLIEDHCVDSQHIFVAGYSNGGFLAAELACRPNSYVAAIVAVAGFHAPEPCERHVPTLVIHGTADPIVPIGPGGKSLIVDNTTPPSLAELLAASIEEELARSAKGAGCNDRPTPRQLADDITELSYAGCSGGAHHKLVLVEGGGHTWPGAALTADADLLGPTTANFDATEASWAFFTSGPS